MRIRTIKPEFWASESMGRLTRSARLVFIGLWSLADDEGRFRADPRYIAGQLLPYDSDGFAESSRALASLLAEGSIRLYTHLGSRYGVITGWRRHQKIDKPSTSKLPSENDCESKRLEATPEQFAESSRAFAEPSPSPREHSWLDQGSGIRDQGEEVKLPLSTSSTVGALAVAAAIQSKPQPPQPKPQPQLQLVPAEATKPKPTSDVEIVFEAWKTTMGHPRSRLGSKRERAVKARLQDGYSVEDLRQAIVGCSKTPHNMGQNERGERYDGLELICRDAEHVDRFMRNAEKPPIPKQFRCENEITEEARALFANGPDDLTDQF